MAFAASGVSDDLIQMTLLGEALDSAAVAVFVFDEDGNILAVNRKGCELTGYVRDRLLEPRRGDSADPAAIPHRLREIAICGVPSESSRSEPRTACSHPWLSRRETRAAGLPFYVAALWEGVQERHGVEHDRGRVA